MIITLAQIRAADPCDYALDLIARHIPEMTDETEFSLGDIAVTIGAVHALWCSRFCASPREAVRLVIHSLFRASRYCANPRYLDSIYALLEWVETEGAAKPARADIYVESTDTGKLIEREDKLKSRFVALAANNAWQVILHDNPLEGMKLCQAVAYYVSNGSSDKESELARITRDITLRSPLHFFAPKFSREERTIFNG